MKEIEDYIADAPEESRSKLIEMRSLIRELAPTADEYIGYGMPGYKLNNKPLVYFAGYKGHIGFYGGNGSFVSEHPELLDGYETSKGTIKFPLDKPLPVDLIKKIMTIRIKENEAYEK